MSDFEYVAIDKKGKTRSGTISASDAKVARRKVIQSGHTVLKIKLSSGTQNNSSGSSNKKQIKKNFLRTKYSSKGDMGNNK